MALDYRDTISSVIDSLRSETGMKLIGAFIVLQVVNLYSQSLYIGGGGLAPLGIATSIVAGVAGIFLTIGAFRALYEEELRQEQFTQNILWPFLRLTGGNIVTTAFVLIAALPIIFGSALSLAGVGIVTVLSGIVSLVLIAYVVLALAPSLPEITIDDSRMFEALDHSVEKTNGEKLNMFIAATPVVLLYLVTGITSAALTGPSGFPLSAVIVTAVLGAVTGVTVYATLVEYHRRL